MSEGIKIKFCPLLLFFLVLFLAFKIKAGQVQPARLILSIGANAISMRPMNDSAIHGLILNFPGLYTKLSVENYTNSRKFIHLDLNMSFNNGEISDGTMKESRLCFNYGIGWVYDVVKFSASPGLCFSSIGYQNNRLNTSYTEVRFAPSLGLQFDLILMKSQYRYLALFIEGSAMLAKSSRWVQQLSIGISWQPSFRKPEKEAPMHY